MSKLLFLLQTGLFIISIQFHSSLAGYESSEYTTQFICTGFFDIKYCKYYLNSNLYIH